MTEHSGADPSAVPRLHLLLRSGGYTVATAESLTGGQLAARFTETPGASETYLGGVVTYATGLKKSLLGVSEETVADCGVVSPECAEAMAAGIRALSGATYGVATTGVAGPDSQEGKPPGLVYVGIAGPGHLEAVELRLEGERGDVVRQTCDRAVSALIEVVGMEEHRVG